MLVSRRNLLRIAKETVLKSALADPGLVAAYLTGSLRSDNPFLGNATDIDIVYIHTDEPALQREIVPLTPEISLDIVHNPRSLYDKPKELRVHPWLGPELYDPMPLHDPQHFFEFIQAGVRDRYDEPANTQMRSRHLEENARKIWGDLQTGQAYGPQQVLGYLNSITLAANAIAVLTGVPLAERRFLLQFPAYARSAGQPGLMESLWELLGAKRVDSDILTGFLPKWETTFIKSAAVPGIDSRIANARLGYYKLAFESLLASENPQAILWPLMLTWTLAASVLPTKENEDWLHACGALGLEEAAFAERIEELDHFLDAVEAIQENLAVSQGL